MNNNMYVYICLRHYQFRECEDVKYRVSANEAAAACAQWNALWFRYTAMASERARVSWAVQQGWISFDSSSSRLQFVHTQHIAFTQRSLALVQVHINFKLSLTSRIALAVGNNEANKNAILFALYTTKAPRLFVPRAHSHYLYWFIVAAAAAVRSQRLLTFPSLKCQPPLINRPCLVSMANNVLIRNTHVWSALENWWEAASLLFSAYLFYLNKCF